MDKLLRILLLLLIPLTVNGCEFIGDVFKTGIWVGVIIILAIVAVVAFVIKLFSKWKSNTKFKIKYNKQK